MRGHANTRAIRRNTILLKILFAIKSLNVEGGGAERVLVDIANELVSRNHLIDVLTLDQPGDSFYTLDSRVRRLDIRVSSPNRPTTGIGFTRSVLRIRQIVRRRDPDVVVAFMHSAYVPFAFSVAFTKIRLVASEHTEAAHFRKRPVQRILVHAAERLALAKTVPASAVRLQHPRRIRPRVYVLPNPVDLDLFSPNTGCQEDQKHLILTVGRLRKEKGHIDLIRAFAALASKFPRWSLRIVGDGELRPLLEAEVTRLGMDNRIQLPGVTRDVAQEYASAAIVALPSLYESFGLVAAEALAAGRPVLAFRDCLGIAEMIESGKNGLLIESKPDRIRNLADGLARLMSDSTLRARLAAAGPDSVRPFALKSVVDTWEQFLLDLVRKSA